MVDTVCAGWVPHAPLHSVSCLLLSVLVLSCCFRCGTGEALSAKPIFGPDFEPHSGVIHKSQSCWKAASGSFSGTRVARTPHLRASHLMSLRAHRFSFGGYDGNLQPTASEPSPKPQTTWHSSESHPGAHLEPTLHCMGEREEPTRSPPATDREPTGNPHGRARGTHAEPTGAHREPTGNPPQTASKKRRSPPPTHWGL